MELDDDSWKRELLDLARWLLATFAEAVDGLLDGTLDPRALELPKVPVGAVDDMLESVAPGAVCPGGREAAIVASRHARRKAASDAATVADVGVVPLAEFVIKSKEASSLRAPPSPESVLALV
mmetsp:Transcript_4648/g.10841  ORF Transcript_4648/g.10841 Transcript_4648/m.10841 type:complete len:123 (-) Transcript_4648:1005-1373(-)